jgi:hypothetical protein
MKYTKIVVSSVMNWSRPEGEIHLVILIAK